MVAQNSTYCNAGAIQRDFEKLLCTAIFAQQLQAQQVTALTGAMISLFYT